MTPTISVSTQGGMFHTFQGVTPRKHSPESHEASRVNGSTSSNAAKRVTTPHACAECKRRKIRCDGQQPCGQCLSSRAPKRCFYDKHRQRVIPSRKTLEALSQSLEECRSILKRLFPHHDVQSLLSLSRPELLGLLDVSATQNGLPSPPLNTSPLGNDLHSPAGLKSGQSLSNLEQIPTVDTEWDEERRDRDPIPAEADDVNALSLAVDRQASYLGASSVKAALMVMIKVQPALRASLVAAPIHSAAELAHSLSVAKHFSHNSRLLSQGPLRAQSSHGTQGPQGSQGSQDVQDAQDCLDSQDSQGPQGPQISRNSENSPPPDAQNSHRQSKSHISHNSQSSQPASASAMVGARKELQRIPWSWKGQTLVDAYFKRIHVFIPMLDEAAFRADYLEGQRCDAPWLALLNTVFAMGSVAGTKSDDGSHFNYYARAMDLLPMDAFGSSHIETVQALAIVGGYYLHYINRPNMANALLGAAIRMASALGLHRESLARGGARDVASAETRRRTWWSLFCLDTWATTTMGRPSFGRWGPAINIQPPELGIAAGRDNTQHAGILPLIENIKFCKIATQIQDLLAITPLLRTEDRCNLDNQLMGWYQNLPWLLRTTDPCAEPLYISRCVMKWRYQNLRLLLHRPVLLGLAASGQANAQDVDAAAVATCRELAKQTIEDIEHEWSRNQMSGWNAAWFLYQAAMVPLVSIFWQWTSPLLPEWQKQIESVLALLEAMEEWSLAARRSRDVVWRMYEASRQPGLMQPQQASALGENRPIRQDGTVACIPQNVPQQQQQLHQPQQLQEQLQEQRQTHHQQQLHHPQPHVDQQPQCLEQPQPQPQSQSQQQPQQQQEMALASGQQGLLLSTENPPSSVIDESELHMSPIGFEPDIGMLGLLDQHGLWDLDGMYWGQAEEEEFATAAAAAAAAATSYQQNINDGMIPMDYSMMNTNPPGTFSFVPS